MSTKSEPLVARYIGYTKDTENHGDEALIWLIRDLLAPGIRVITSGEEPYDIALLGGGTLINQSPWLIDWFEQALDKSRSGSGMVFGTGVGDLSFWGNQFTKWKPLLKRCDCIGVRGPLSLALLEEHGISGARWIGDPYLWLRAPVIREPIPQCIGVNLGGTNDSLWGTNDQDFLACMTEVLKQLKAQGWTFEWISVWSRDLPLLEEVRQNVAPDSSPVLDARTHVLEAYSALGKCELFVGEKLHACAMAAVAGVPFISLEYQPKVRDFAASLGMDPWTISTAQREADEYLKRVNEFVQVRQSISDSLLTRLADLRTRLVSFGSRCSRPAVAYPERTRGTP